MRLFGIRKTIKLPSYAMNESPFSIFPSSFPPWLHKKLPKRSLEPCRTALQKSSLPTVCEEAKCPNLCECYAKKTATFLALGKACTRSCGFCAVEYALRPTSPDPDEPRKVLKAISDLDLKHVVITQVTRDDLPDGGAKHMANIINNIRKNAPQVTTEVLVSDFNGDEEALRYVLEVNPTIFSHNIETVERLSNKIRHKASFGRSLQLLQRATKFRGSKFVKSGLMVGLGEEPVEVIEAMKALANAGCDILTIGQYLQPHKNKLPVKVYVPPEQFTEYTTIGEQLGIRYVYAGPFVRSSYNAQELLQKIVSDDKRISRC